MNEKCSTAVIEIVKKELHIVCPDSVEHSFYGLGSFLRFELEALGGKDISIVLHLFGENPVSESIHTLCAAIHHYPICSGHKAVAFGIPYEVAARTHPLLEERLRIHDGPVVFYNWESTGVLLQPGWRTRPHTYVRLLGIPNVQAKETGIFSNGLGKKLFHFNESRRITQYEKHLASNCSFLALHQKDHDYLVNELSAASVLFPMLLQPKACKSQPGTGNYCFYFGDFSLPEHERSATWLLQEVFEHSSLPFVLAGKAPSASLKKLVERNEHACLVESPSEEEVIDLIRKSHIQLLPFLSETGLKSEIYNALLYGRHCLYYGDGYACPLVKESCHHIENAADARVLMESLFDVPFHEEAIALRNKYFVTLNDSAQRAKVFVEQLSTAATA